MKVINAIKNALEMLRHKSKKTDLRQKVDKAEPSPQPPWVTTAEDVRSTKVRSFKFYNKDIKKMKRMTPLEALDFQAQLVREGRIYYSDDRDGHG